MGTLNVYVLGAGASYVHGAPLTNQILHYALREAALPDNQWLKLVREFLRDIFHFDVKSAGTSAEDFPGLVDVLSTVDMALERRESLTHTYNQERLRKVREALEYVIYKAVQHSLSSENPQPRRSQATRNFVRRLQPNDVIISLNYDVMVDIALQHRSRQNFDFSSADLTALEGQAPVGVDYGVEFSNASPAKPNENQLLKLHGSFNWLWSPVTGDLYFGGFHKTVGMLFNESPRGVDEFFQGQRDPSDLQPIMITPTHLKDLRNFHLGFLWRKAERALSQAASITFIGYSLPSDDLHIRYLFKRGIEARSPAPPPTITVIDYDNKTKPGDTFPVEANYRRFFGGNVQYSPLGFEQYVEGQMPVPA